MTIIDVDFLFSVAFILIGSLAFHISALISGHNIYREHSSQESYLLSIVVGIVIYLLSPISYIILNNNQNILVQILNFKVLLAFFCCSFGFGLIFGGFGILSLREHFLDWLRDKSKMKFWISYYGFVWDDLLTMVKKNGEVFIQTHDTFIKGLLNSFSIRNEPKEIVLEIKEPKEMVLEAIDGSKCKIGGKEESVQVLIPGSEIKRILVPERSFKKHFESMEHISQGFYFLIITIGFLFLSYSTYLTKYYISNLSLKFFYDILSEIFIIMSIFLLVSSFLTTKKDFDNVWSFLALSPCYTIYNPIILLFVILYFIFYTQLSIKYINLLIYLFIFSFIIIYFLINMKLKKPIKTSFGKISQDFDKSQDILENIVQYCYLHLSCNEKDSIEKMMVEIIEKYNFNTSEKLDKFVAELADLKRKKIFGNEYLKTEDYNIIYKLKNHIEKAK